MMIGSEAYMVGADCACFFRGGVFTFSFNISTSYPHDAPKVKCKTKVRGHVSSCGVSSCLHKQQLYQFLADCPSC
jgi:ubiquitin-protein ligase